VHYYYLHSSIHGLVIYLVIAVAMETVYQVLLVEMKRPTQMSGDTAVY